MTPPHEHVHTPAPASPGVRRRRLLAGGAAGLGALAVAGLPRPAAGAPAATAGPRAAAAQAAPARLAVDLGAPEGPVLRGAAGALYGLSDDGVPSDAALAPLKFTSVSQKPEGGAQHPNGDAITVSESFFRNSEGDILVMMQDMYAEWPYEDLGIEDYLGKVERIAADIAAAEQRDRFVYVLFNEPDYIWYDLDVADTGQYRRNRDRFLQDWTRVYRLVRSRHPGARIAGPNEAAYDARFLPDFLAYAKANDVLPDILTWHELGSGSLASFQGHYDHYRSIERAAGVGPLPVNIDEYANRRDLSVPGQLVQWAAMFERNKVHANMAYWDAAGNLSGTVVRANAPNGAWWFFRWYAGLTGETVAVTPPRPNAVDTLQGMAALDPARRQAQAIVGGAAGDADVTLRNVARDVLGTEVSVVVSEAAWSGYEGQHPAPRVLSRTKTAVAADGTVTVPLRGMHVMSAYRIVLTPAGAGTPAAADVPWSAAYEAEDAAITDGTVRTHGTPANANGYAASGTKDVGDLGEPTSRVDFTVAVPRAGRYDLAVLYGNQSGVPATQRLLVDGGASGGTAALTYPSTENWTYRGKQETTLRLSAGSHTLTLAHDTAEVTLDRIDLTEHRTPRAVYEATLADITGEPGFDYSSAAGPGTGALLLGPGDQAVFDVYAPRDAYYTLVPRAAGPVRLALHGTALTAAPDTPRRVYLLAGNNRVTVTARAGARVGVTALEAEGAGDTDGVTVLQAAQARLAGGATLVDSPYASGGSYIGNLGNAAESTAEFTVTAAAAGRHMLVVRYANNDREEGHAYNTDIISRKAEITVSGTTRQAVFKNTWGWDDYWTLGIPVDLRDGPNAIRFGNPSAWAPDIDRIEVAPVLR